MDRRSRGAAGPIASPPGERALHPRRPHGLHRHPLGQVLHVTEGRGLAQRRGAQPEVIRAGDTVRFEPDEEHWHGAGPEHFMTHLALHEHADDGVATHWGAHVTEEEYTSAPVAD